MFYLYTVTLAASFLIYIEFAAITFAAALVLTILSLLIFSAYFQKDGRKGTLFFPVVLISASAHITILIEMLIKGYIKNINIWVLIITLTAVCVLMAFGGKETITYMSALIFFFMLAMTIMDILTGKVTDNQLITNNIYQLVLSAVSPISTGFCLAYMHRMKQKNVYVSFVAGTVIAVLFMLFEMSFFKSLTLTFIAPTLIVTEIYFLRTVIFPGTKK